MDDRSSTFEKVICQVQNETPRTTIKDLRGLQIGSRSIITIEHPSIDAISGRGGPRRTMDPEPKPLEWSAQLNLTDYPGLVGDKLCLPQQALEQLLAAAPSRPSTAAIARPYTNTFDPHNRHTFAAERLARSEFQYERKQLPHPLTFRLVNPSNGRAVFAGITEFSADQGEIGLSQFLKQALGLEAPQESTNNMKAPEHHPSTTIVDGHPRSSVTVHAKQVPKGTFVKLRPLEAGYDPEDWKSLLEQHLRRNFTTLTKHEILTVPAGHDQYQFLIDKLEPNCEGICVVDTDLEVDIEALNEEQARETLRRIAAKTYKVPDSDQASSAGGQLDLFRLQQGQVLDGDYVDFQIQSWVRSQGLDIEMQPRDDDDHLELFASPFGPRQRAKPREDEHLFADFEGRAPKRIRLSPGNVELEHAESIWVSVHAPNGNKESLSLPKAFNIRAAVYDPSSKNKSQSEDVTIKPGPDETICINCKQVVPKQSLMLHESFCHRNNIKCPLGCNRVFQKRSPTWQSHWHCTHDTASGDTLFTKENHDRIFHTSYTCPSCACPKQFSSLPALAQHRTTTCPEKRILCRFCHLITAQEGDPDPSAPPDPEVLLSGLTPHELADGGRTTECHLCARIVRLRDMETHLKHHDFERLSRAAPRPCRNLNCGRTLDGTGRNGDTRAGQRIGQGAGNDIGLCSTCFGPLYVTIYDPEGKALQRRVERRYLQQLLSGCGKSWCRNDFCKTGRMNQSPDGDVAGLPTKEASPMVKPFVSGLSKGETPLHFCVDEASQRRNNLAAMLAAEGRERPGPKQYGLAWCVAATEAQGDDLDKARDWLRDFAPSVQEETSRS